MQFRDQRTPAGEYVARHVRMQSGRHPGQGVGHHGDGRYACCKRSAMRRNVDAERQPADDRKPRNALCESSDQPVAGRLSVRGRLACSDDGDTTCREGFDAALYVYYVGIIGDFAQQRRVFRVGGGDGRNVVAATVGEFLFGGRKSLPADDLLRRVGTQVGFGDEFIGGGGENAPRIAEQLQQMHGSFYTDARSHLKGNIFDGHSRE